MLISPAMPFKPCLDFGDLKPQIFPTFIMWETPFSRLGVQPTPWKPSPLLKLFDIDEGFEHELLLSYLGNRVHICPYSYPLIFILSRVKVQKSWYLNFHVSGVPP
jgi:hypothetical protein